MLILRSLVFNVLFFAFTAGVMLFWAPALPWGRETVFQASRAWCAGTLWLLRIVCNIKLEVRGRHNLPTGGCLIAAKHQSAWDTIVFEGFLPAYCFVLKHELLKIPLFGWYLRAGEQIAIDRKKGGSSLTQVIKKSAVALAQGRQLVIFPEGTRTQPGAAPDYKMGVAHIYAGGNTVCVPVALNSGLFWGRESFIKRPGTIVLSFLEPIPPGMDKKAFAHLVETRIEVETNALIAEALAKDASLKSVLAA